MKTIADIKKYILAKKRIDEFDISKFTGDDLITVSERKKNISNVKASITKLENRFKGNIDLGNNRKAFNDKMEELVGGLEFYKKQLIRSLQNIEYRFLTK